MAFIPLHVETQNKTLKSISVVPVIGGILFLVLMMVPVAALLVPLCDLCGLGEEVGKKLMPFGVIIVDVILRTQGTRVSILFMPAWVTMGIVGILSVFGVLE